MCIDISPDEEGDNVEERHPSVFGKEFLGKGQRDGRGDPADFHDGHEASADGGADLVEGAGAGDDGHRGEIDGVLNGRDLRPKRLALQALTVLHRQRGGVDCLEDHVDVRSDC